MKLRKTRRARETSRIRLWQEIHVLWKTAARILKGQPTGAKLIVLSIFLLSVGAGLEIIVDLTVGAFSFIVAGFSTLIFGLAKYKDEINDKLIRYSARI